MWEVTKWNHELIVYQLLICGRSGRVWAEMGRVYRECLRDCPSAPTWWGSSDHSQGSGPAYSVLSLVLTFGVLQCPKWSVRPLVSLGLCSGSSCRHSRKASYFAKFPLLHWTQTPAQCWSVTLLDTGLVSSVLRCVTGFSNWSPGCNDPWPTVFWGRISEFQS